MREGFRPYTKEVTLTSLAANQLITHDTAGNSIECNYCKVEPVSGQGTDGAPSDGFFFVTVNIDSAKGYSNNDTANTLKGNSDTSGSLGMGGSRSSGAVIISTLSPDTFSTIKISQKDADDTTYLVTYGVIAQSNNLKDSRTFRGN